MQEKYWYLIGGIAIGIVLLGALVFSLKPTGQQSASQLQMVATSTQLLQVAAAPPPTYKLSNLQPGTYTVVSCPTGEWLDTAANTCMPTTPTSIATEAQLFQLQAECTTQAEKDLVTYEQDMAGNGNGNFDQVNYYNSNFNECFVLFSNSMSFKGTSSEYLNLMDAYTTEDLADCAVGADPNNPLEYDTEYAACHMYPQYKLVSYQQFQNYVNQRMGAGTVE